MLQLPLAFVIALIATLIGAAVSVSRMPSPTRALLTAFFLMLAMMFILVGLRDGYGVELARFVQPVIAMLIQPTLYLAFNTLTEDPPTSAGKLLFRHGWPALFVAIFIGLAFMRPDVSLILVDIFIFPSLAFYIVRMFSLLRAGPDKFIRVTSQGYKLSIVGIIAGIGLFGFILVLEVAIFISRRLFSGGYSEFFVQVSIISIAVAMILFAFAAALYIARLATFDVGQKNARFIVGGGAHPSKKDNETINALDELLAERQLYRDSGITLARIARRLGQPARQISLAVNRCRQENFSRYINGYRVRYAQESLKTTDAPITELMLEAGFSTKSNFNSEFSRVVGMTPSRYRSKHRPGH
jgi:AraC-like DNA-binding protein